MTDELFFTKREKTPQPPEKFSFYSIAIHKADTSAIKLLSFWVAIASCILLAVAFFYWSGYEGERNPSFIDVILIFLNKSLSSGLIYIFSGLLILRVLVNAFNIFKGVKKGEAWFFEDPKNFESKWKDFNKKRPNIFEKTATEIEKELAIIASKNRIEKIKISNSAINDSPQVNINIDWSASKAGNPTLYLYRDEGDIQMSVKDVRSRATAKRLFYSERGEKLHYPDSDVSRSGGYKYYAWIEVDIHGLMILSFKKHAHVARYGVRFEEVYDRKAKNLDIRRKFEELKNSPPTSESADKEEEEDSNNYGSMATFIDKELEKAQSKEELIEKTIAKIDGMDASDEVKADLATKAFNRINKNK